MLIAQRDVLPKIILPCTCTTHDGTMRGFVTAVFEFDFACYKIVSTVQYPKNEIMGLGRTMIVSVRVRVDTEDSNKLVPVQVYLPAGEFDLS